MDKEDARVLEPFGFRHEDIVFLQGRDHVAAQHAHQHRPLAERKRQRRQEKAANVADRVLLEWHPAGCREQIELHGKQIDQQDCPHEGRHGEHAERAA